MTQHSRISAVSTVAAFLLFLFAASSFSVFAQQTAAANAVVPTLVQFSGVLTGSNGKPLTTITGVTFALYAGQEGGAPLWLETQNVQPDKNGNYTVQLGSTTSQGLPSSLFVSGQARWLGVQAQGQEPQPRIMLLSVPYALKAGDAQTLNGQPASAFLATSGNNSLSPNGVINNALGGTGTKDYVPLWLSKSKLGSSKLFQSTAGDLGIGTATPAANLDVNGTTDIRNTLTLFPNGSSPTLSVSGTAFEVSSSGTVTFVSGQTFPGTGTITGVTAGSGLSGGGNSGDVTLNVPSAGITNAMLQNSSLTVNAGTALTGGGAVSLGGSTTLNVDTTKVPLLSANNTFAGNQAVNGNVSATGVVTGNSYQIGSNLFAFGSYASGNAFLGFAGSTSANQNVFSDTAVGLAALPIDSVGFNVAIGSYTLNSNTTGYYNTASGLEALYSNTAGIANTASGLEALGNNTTGYYNTASGLEALSNNTTGYYNTASGVFALYYNTTGSNNTALGYQAGTDASTTNLNNAAAIGAFADVSESNALVLGAISGTNGCTPSNNCAGVNVGIGTTTPAGPLHINGPAGAPPSSLPSSNNGLLLGSDGTSSYKWIQSYGGSLALNPVANGVSIGTTAATNLLTLVKGGGAAIADGWSTYSSRRWKTNIQTLPDALAKVEQLRGVSYDLKDSGKHEIGVIAEEVGKVVPEVVTYEDNGKDARGVDYSRLTALLIEATKGQQALIRQQQRQIHAQQAQIAQLSSQVKAIQTSLKVNGRGAEVRTVKTQVPIVQQ